ncbi:hypothetical protein CGCTS75_v005742 [Colletotrichum tropicale]|nr:hypothetical protein CGCTS75_v005742 [Colletotrichum tropicale]
MPRRGTSSRGGRGGKAAGGAAKRKRDPSDAGNLDGIQKRRTDNDSKEEGQQIFMLPNASETSSDEEVYEVIIVPTGATGSSSIKREYPQIISFTWPEKKADKELGGTVGEAADGKKDTYSTVLKQVLNDQLKAFDKEVIDLGEEITLSPPSDARFKSDVDGHIHFLNEGIIFHRGDAEDARDGKGKTVGLSLVCSATEPFYKDEEEGGSKTKLKFRGIDYSLVDGLEEYMKAHDIQVMLCEQSFYDYKKDKPMTGFMPLMK